MPPDKILKGSLTGHGELKAVPDERAMVAVTDPAAVPRGQGQRILFLDDEQSLAQIGASLLTAIGYAAEGHTTSIEALATVLSRPGAFDLIITDLKMPGMTGVDLAQQLQNIHPGLPVILVTGHSTGLTPERLHKLGIRELLLKPYTFQALGLAVNRVLSI